MALFDTGQLVGKTIWAKQRIPLKRFAADAAPVIYVVEPGKQVGVLESVISTRPGLNDNPYFQFRDQKGAYYAESGDGKFGLREILDQGAKTVQTQVKEEQAKAKAQAEADKPFTDKLLGTVKWLGVAIGVGLLGKALIEGAMHNRSK